MGWGNGTADGEREGQRKGAQGLISNASISTDPLKRAPVN